MVKHKRNKRVITFLIGPVSFLFVFFLFPTSQSIAADAIHVPLFAPKLALATLIWVFLWWILEPVHLAITALLPPLIFSSSGILTWEKSLSSFANPVLWIFMAGFVFAVVFKKWELDQWIATHISRLYKGKNVFLHTFFIAGLPVFLLGFTGSITASASVIYPLLLSFLLMLNLHTGHPYKQAALLLLAQSASSSAMLYLISTAPNIVAKNLINEHSSKNLTFLNWLAIGTPHALIGLVIAAIVIFIVLKPESLEIKEFFRKRHIGLTPRVKKITKEQFVILIIILLTICLWFLPSILQLLPFINEKLNTSLKSIMPEAMPAVLAIFLFGLIKINQKPLLEWKEIALGIDWGVIFLFGGGIVLGLGLESSGFANWLASSLRQLLGNDPEPNLVFAFSAILGFLLTYVASNIAAAIIACPIAVSLAIAAKVPVEPPIIAAALASSISTSLPSTTPPMAIIYGSGEVSISNMVKVGLISDFIRLILLILLGPILVGMVL